MSHSVLFLTQRGLRHQQAALDAAPDELDVTIRRGLTRAEILALLPEMEFLISERTGVIDAEMIAAGKRLRLIQRLGSMTHDIDLGAAVARSLPVCAVPVRGCIMVAEHLVLQMLATSKRLPEMMELTNAAGYWGAPPRRCDEDYFAYNWSMRTGVGGLWQATVGILGFGEIGAELARRLIGFECTVLYNKRGRLPATTEAELCIRFASQDELLATSDFVVMLLPFFPETEQTIGAQAFGRMKQGAWFVSCGGSGVVSEAALAEALISGHVAGAALDTFTEEPISSDNPILPLGRDPHANVILTPHTAAGTVNAAVANRSSDYDNLLRILQGDELRYRVV